LKKSKIVVNASLDYFNRPQVAVQPVERFLDHLIPGEVMTGFVNDAADADDAALLPCSMDLSRHACSCWWYCSPAEADVMGEHRNGALLRWLGWTCAAAMPIATVIMLVTAAAA